MKPAEFISALDEEKIMGAIRRAERNTSGEIRVYVSHREVADALARAQARFVKLGMHKTRHRNAVMIYLAPLSRSFAIVGDSGVHEKCGDAFWKETSAHLSHDLKNGLPTVAILRAVRTIGQLLAEHFPAEPGTRDKLPDHIERDDTV